MRKFWLLCLFCSFLCGKSLLADYQRMSRGFFCEKIVSNTIVGVTRQSRSLYMLYFREDGSCELWKQNQIYLGHWWIDQDSLGEDVVHAFWPDYISGETKSLFSPKNPAFGKPTSLSAIISIRQPAESSWKGKLSKPRSS